MVRKIFLVKPNAKSNSLGRNVDGSLWIRIAAAPTDGKANDAIIRFLSQSFAIPRSSCRLVNGASSRFKTFELEVSEEEFEKVLSKTGSIG